MASGKVKASERAATPKLVTIACHSTPESVGINLEPYS
jgi:hypothetical protein